MTGYYIISMSILSIAILFTLWLKRSGRVYDHLMLFTAVYTGFLMAEWFSVEYWYYHLPLLGITTILSLFVMALLLFFFGAHTRKIKNSFHKGHVQEK